MESEFRLEASSELAFTLEESPEFGFGSSKFGFTTVIAYTRSELVESELEFEIE